jgi:hypothetical protein
MNIKTRLLEWVGNCFFNLNAGIDYMNLLDKGQKDNLLLAIKYIILTSEGVIRLNQLSAELDSKRNLAVSYEIDTIYGSLFQNMITQELI